MKPEDIIKKYEIDRVEFKQELPDQHIKWLKTVVAFANTSGGTVVVGIEDKTNRVVGVEKSNVPIVCDQIANAISDGITPQIMPDIFVEEVEGKNVVFVEVFPSPHRPYYIASLGKEKGTFVRIGGTTRSADVAILKELELEGANMSYDSLVYRDAEYSEKSAKKLCRAIEKYIYEYEGIRKKVSPDQLERWGLLKHVGNKLLPTNAFMMLTDNPFREARVQCGLFKGTERVKFLDKREFDGPLFEQIEDAYQFVLKHINLGVRIEGIFSKNEYELPKESIREMIVNAVTHRNYAQSASVQVAVFDNRVEVTSPGMLYGGITLKEVLSGASRIRNKAIATVFSQMHIIDDWGTGIQKIIDGCRDYGISDPEFIELGTSFRVNIYRDKNPVAQNQGNNASDKQATYASDKQVNEQDNEQVGEQVNEQVGDYRLRLLRVLSDGERTKADMLSLIGLSAAYGNYAKHIVPLINEGYIEMTIPTKPTSRLQKYRLTAKGRSMI